MTQALKKDDNDQANNSGKAVSASQSQASAKKTAALQPVKRPQQPAVANPLKPLQPWLKLAKKRLVHRQVGR